MAQELKYTKTHEWVEFLEENKVRIGLTEYAVEELGDLVFIDLPEVDDEVEIEDSFADVESVKAVSDVFSPVTGVITAVNEDLLNHPELVNESPLEAWFIEVDEITEFDDLITKEEYEEFIREEA
ncbi:MAG: glycine cleavage system protein GcvH [Clostridiales bacterium]|jgi:glycine cleavage system H protein|nr:glycine cleavage system protein GcvH [Clostridiales bacterium]